MAVRGLTIPIGADASEFNKEIKKMDKNTRELKKETGYLAKALDVEWDSSRFELAQKKAQEAIAQTDVKVQALKDRLQTLDEAGEDKGSPHYQKIKNELIKAQTEAVLLKQKLDELNNLKIDRLVKSFDEAGSKIEGAGKKLSAFSAAAAGILASFSAIGLSAVSAADEISKISSQLNISAESLQRWQYAAMQTNVEFDELRDSFITVQAEVGKLARGEIDKASLALMELGFTAEDAVAPMEKNFEKIVNALSAVEDPAQRALISTKLFGESAAARIGPLLQIGAAGLAELTSEFEAMGYMTNEQVESLREFDNTMNRIKASLSAVKNTIGVSLIPVMEGIANMIQDKVVPAIQNLSNWFSSLSDNQKNFLFGSLAAIAALGPALIIIGKMTAGVGGLIKTFNGLGKALTFLSAHPIIAIIGVIAALIATLYSTNEKFRESINSLISSLGDALAPVLDTLMGLFNTLLDAITPIINMLGDILTPVIDTLSDSMALLAPVIQLVTLPIQALVKALTFVLSFLQPIIKLITSLSNILTSVLGKALDWITNKISSILSKITGWIEDGINWIIDKVNWLIDKINILGKVLGFEIDRIEKLDFSPSFNAKIEEGASEKLEPSQKAQQAITNIPQSSYQTTNIDNDYSTKHITVNLTIQNYGGELDYDDVINQINLRLAEQM